MVNNTSDLSEYRQLKAKQDLLAAKLLFDNNHYAQSLNQILLRNIPFCKSIISI